MTVANTAPYEGKQGMERHDEERYFENYIAYSIGETWDAKDR